MPRPVRERRNPARRGKINSGLLPKKSLFPFPSSEDPVPDAPIDYTELWKVISMSKPPDTSKASSRGTAAYDRVLYGLGIDILENLELCTPEDINMDGLQLHPTVQFPHFSTDEQLYELGQEH